MPGVPVTVRGRVRDDSTGASVDGGRVCVTSQHTLVAGATIQPDGTFRLEVRDLAAGAYSVLVLVGVLDGWRRTVHVADAAVDYDVGELRLRPCELPPGIHGQPWDVVADRPVLAGRVSLEQDGTRVATAAVDVDGWFAFDLTCRQPLPPGPYAVVTDCPGYPSRRVPLAVVERVTAYQLGRVDLWPAESGQQAG